MITIEIVGSFFNNHSLSIINRNLAINLNSIKDIELFITPLDSIDLSQKINKDELRTLNKLKKSSGKEPDIQIRHTYPPIWRYPVSPKTKVIFIQPWEFSKIPMEWQYKFETFADHLITPSMWTGDKFLEAGLNPDRLSIVPNGYNPTIFNRNQEESLFFDKRKFTFVFVGTHQPRKGLDLLLNTWKDTFVRADNVQLFIKDTPQIYGQNNLLSQILSLQYHVDCGKIIYNSDTLSEHEMANIYKNCKVIVHPYRAEGYGMPVQEAVACGAYPIITDRGPTEEFIPREIGARITAEKKLTDLTNPVLFAIKPGDSLTNMGGHSWILEPNVENLKFQMSLIYRHHERQQLLDKVKLYNNVNTWENITKKYLEVIKEVHEQSTKPRRFT